MTAAKSKIFQQGVGRLAMAGVVATGIMVAGQSAQADPIIQLRAGFDDELELRTQDDFTLTELNGTYEWSGGPWVEEGLGWTIEAFAVEFRDNPHLDSSFTVTNNTSETRSFTLEVTMQSGVDFAETLASGALNASIIDNDGEGASLAASEGAAMYSALIEGTELENMRPYPDGLFYGTGAEGVEVFLNESSFDDVAGPALASGDEITLRHQVDISAGDTANLNGELTIVPEPSAMLLLGAGAGLMLYRRPRRENA